MRVKESHFALSRTCARRCGRKNSIQDEPCERRAEPLFRLRQCEARMSKKALLLNEIEQTPEPLLDEVLDCPGLHAGDTESQTVGCRHTNPDICAKNSLPIHNILGARAVIQTGLCRQADSFRACIAFPPPARYAAPHERIPRQPGDGSPTRAARGRARRARSRHRRDVRPFSRSRRPGRHQDCHLRDVA